VGSTIWGTQPLCTNHISLFASQEQKAAYLPRLARARALGAWGLPSPLGLRTRRHDTRAVDEAGASFLNLQGLINHCRRGRVTVVNAVTDPTRGHKASPPSCSRRGCPASARDAPRKLGLHASNTSRAHFDHVAVPAGHLLGDLGMGFVNTMQVLEAGGIAMAAMAVGIATAPSTPASST